jgi:outer membrane protein OmpA-like peptidoglycan-associated protein
MKRATIFLWVMLIILSATLVACANKTQPPSICSAVKTTQLANQVKARGGQYVGIGDDLTITMPTCSVFKGNSKNMQPLATQLFVHIAQRLSLKCFTSRRVIVTAYTGTLPRTRANRVLAQQRAKVVAKILLKHGVSRLIVAKGKYVAERGQTCHINRIEIVTRRLY